MVGYRETAPKWGRLFKLMLFYTFDLRKKEMDC